MDIPYHVEMSLEYDVCATVSSLCQRKSKDLNIKTKNCSVNLHKLEERLFWLHLKYLNFTFSLCKSLNIRT
jgi:hypothetical protein